jgi:Uma2 family endonuclease
LEYGVYNWDKIIAYLEIDRMISTQIRLLTSAEYYQMMETGIIQEGERVELISGQIFTMAAKGTRHTVSTTSLLEELLIATQRRAIIRCQDPITLPNNSEPEPDIVVARLRQDKYIESHPTAVDIILIIEVADSTLKFDQEVKAPLYATAGIQEYWIVNLVADRLEIHSQPEGGIYTNVQILMPPRSINLPHFPEISLNINDFFPAQKT